MYFRFVSRHSMKAAAIWKSQRWLLQIQHIRVNPARLLDLALRNIRLLHVLHTNQGTQITGVP